MKMDTPCIHICELDGRGVCIGCFRTAEEIARWRQMTDRERLAIMKDVNQRRVQQMCDIKANE